jgi:hypothetical protein
MFGIMYLSIMAQLVYVLVFISWDTKFIALGLLAFEWLALVAARYLSKKSAGNSGFSSHNGGRRH